MSLFSFSALPPLSLYIHVPWCLRKCPYCDFNSHAATTGLPEQDYLRALIADLEQELPDIWGRTVDSIFIGGGTPSLFSSEGIDRLLSDVRARLPLTPDAEITLEANPGTFEQKKFSALRAAGINRLSIGVQSFNDLHLKKLGRVHDGTEARRAMATARQAGFDNVNLDLMFGLPEQTPAQAFSDLETALSFSPEHISHYQLTLEPNTLFAHRPPRLPDEETAWHMQRICQQRLAGSGYEQYEVSAWARSDYHCRHNLNYWQFGDYLGIGAGAHSKLTHASHQQISRHWKLRNPVDYMQAAGGSGCIGGKRLLNRQDVALEFMMNTLRQPHGFDSRLFQERTGMPLNVVHDSLEQAQQRGLLEYSRDRIEPSSLGMQHLNTLLEMFMAPEQTG